MHPLIIIGLIIVLIGSFLIHLGTKKAADKGTETVVNEISLSKEKVISEVQNLDLISRKKIFEHLAPEFENVKQEFQISNDQLFQRISELDATTKKEILKIVRPNLEYMPSQTKCNILKDRTYKTTYFFGVPTNQDVPITDFKIQFDHVILKAEMWRKDQNQNSMIEARFDITHNTNGLFHKIYNISMNQYIVLEIWSQDKLNITNLEIN